MLKSLRWTTKSEKTCVYIIFFDILGSLQGIIFVVFCKMSGGAVLTEECHVASMVS